MATPKTISSKINASTCVASTSGRAIYITAILAETNLDIDSGGAVTTLPIALASPIRCNGFTCTSSGHVAYYESL